jgi:hypothetical protein
LKAQRQQHALLSGNSLEYEIYSGRSVPKAAVVQPQGPVANGRKKVKDEISKYLDGMVASKRPGKSVRMNRNFLNAFAYLIGKEYADEYNRDDVIKFRNGLLDEGYKRKYIDTQMDFVLTFFRHWIKSPIHMERGDRLDNSAAAGAQTSSVVLSDEYPTQRLIKSPGTLFCWRTDRGPDRQRRYLVVIDGSKALRAGVERDIGDQVEVQRCQIPKRRNVKEYLPENCQN